MSIVITDAGKSLESGGRHIVYTIRTGVGFVFRAPCTKSNGYNRILKYDVDTPSLRR